jgi:predicted amino acid dehydrogenase
VPVTSGNALTVYAAHAALRHVLDRFGVAADQARVAIVGYPGSIGLAVARMLLAEGARVDLVHSGRPTEAQLRRHVGEHLGQVQFFADVAECYARDRFFVTATSVGDVIDESRLVPGSVVVDVALPRDVVRSRPPRPDVLTVDGGFVNAAPEVLLGGELAGLTVNRHLNGCLAETMILALEGRAESFSIGRELDLDAIAEIGAIADRHGFSPLPLASWDEPVPERVLERLGELQQPRGREGSAASTREAYRRHADRLLVNHLEFNFIDVVASTAQGCHITADEVEYPCCLMSIGPGRVVR